MAALLFALAAAGAETLRPKNIDISLTARWDETPLSVESAEVMADEGLFWDYAAALHEPEGGGSDQEVLAAIEGSRAVRNILDSQAFLRPLLNRDTYEATFREIDTDGSGELSYEEFKVFCDLGFQRQQEEASAAE